MIGDHRRPNCAPRRWPPQSRSSLSARPKRDHGVALLHVTDAVLAISAADFAKDWTAMGKLRTANKRHNRAIVTAQARKKAAESVVEQVVIPDEAGQ